MAYDYFDLLAHAQQWVNQASRLGWLPNDIVEQFSEDNVLPNVTNSPHDTRPLLVAFMGGTGVGKSSLLNRLAGLTIAKAGIARPTSHEITVFHHDSVRLQHLPLEHVHCTTHHDETKKHVVWIDTPDVDSTEQSNRKLVLSWLPYIDVLIYVVSPERYRDDKAWQLLLAEGAKHAWLFVFNQWDKGQFVQYSDFEQQLHKAGFSAPLMFKTACVDDSINDEFAQLASTLYSLATSHTIEQLERRGLQVRKVALKAHLQQTRPLLGEPLTRQKMQSQWQKQWQRVGGILQQGLLYSAQHTAAYYADHATDLFDASNNVPPIWDNWAQGQFDDALNEFVYEMHQAGLPSALFKQRLLAIREQAPLITRSQIEIAVRKALATPGNALQRGFLKFMHVCEILLPLAAMMSVSYRVFIGYFYETAYLGLDFAVHSSFLIGLTWLIPTFILKKSQPSLKKSALKGVYKGLQNALNIIDSEVMLVINALQQQQLEQQQQLDELIVACDAQPIIPVDDNSPLARMLHD